MVYLFETLCTEVLLLPDISFQQEGRVSFSAFVLSFSLLSFCYGFVIYFYLLGHLVLWS